MLAALGLRDSPLAWVIFAGVVLTVMVIDLGVLHRTARAVSVREAWVWTGVWVGLGLLFGAGVAWEMGRKAGLEYITAYLIEESLSVDNIFVFIVLFRYFAVPDEYKHRVLFWGIIGAVLMRGTLIFAGVALIARFEWLIYVFGAILIYSGYKMLFSGDAEVHPEHNPLLKLARRFLPITPAYEGQNFVVRRDRRLWGTPLLLVLLVVESTDLLFALDSVPAVLAISKDPFIILTSNVFAILGLRSLYFVLAGILDKFRYLKIGLSLVLAFVGTKMLVHALHIEIPIHWSLVVVGALIGGSVAASMLVPERHDDDDEAE